MQPNRGLAESKPPAINPYAVLVLAVITCSFGSLFARLAEAPPIIVAFYRIGLTTVILGPVAWVTCRKEILGLNPRELLIAAASGLFLALHFYTWITSLYFTTVASSTVLVSTHPLFVVAGSYLFLKEKVSAQALIGSILAIGGCVIIGLGDFALGGKAFLGDMLAVAGAGFVAAYFVIGRGLRRKLSLLSYVVVVYSTCSLVLLFIALTTNAPLYPYPPETWALFLALAVVPTIGGHTLFNWVLGHLPAPVVSVSILGEPVVASILAVLFLAESPTLQQAAGGAIIIIGMLRFFLSK
ncbi:MAG: DMT family transporter [Bacillota bacterium]